MSKLLYGLYDRTLQLAGHRHALALLFLVAFVESSVFPIPPDVMIIPMILAAREKAWRIAAVATLGSILGGLAGYAIGYFFFEQIGRPVMEAYGYLGKFEDFAAYYNEWGAWIVAGAGFTPFPYKVITIASGVTQLDLGIFVLASLISRAGRFFLLAALLWYFGPPIRRFIESNLPLLTAIFFVLLLGGFVALRYLF